MLVHLHISLCMGHSCFFFFFSSFLTPLTFNPSLQFFVVNAESVACPKFVLIWHWNWHPHGSGDTQDSWKRGTAICQLNNNGFIIQCCPVQQTRQGMYVPLRVWGEMGFLPVWSILCFCVVGMFSVSLCFYYAIPPATGSGVWRQKQSGFTKATGE